MGAPAVTGLAAQLVLVVVFAVAATTKLADGRRAGQAGLVAFGVPTAFAPGLALALPVFEVALAAGLVAPPVAHAAAAAALGLLSAFCVVVGLTLARGLTPACPCFGSLHARPIHAGTLARNLVLASVAAVVLAGGPTRFGSIWAAVAVAATCGAAALLIRHRRASVPARPAREFALPDATGATVTLAELRARGAPVLLVFSSPGCPACSRLLPRVAAWQREHAGALTIAVIAAGPHAEPEAHGLGSLLLDPGAATATAYGVQGTPTGVLVGRDGTLGRAALGEPEIAAVVAAHVPAPSRRVVRTLTRRRTLELAGAGALVGASAAWLGAAVAPSAGLVCRQPGLGRCTSQAALRSRVAETLCRFEPPKDRGACRRRAHARLAALEQGCRDAHCKCAVGSVPCTSRACCGAGERCETEGPSPRCVPEEAPAPPAPGPVGPCPSDGVTLESLNTARAALLAGADDVAVSPGGCLRYRRTVVNGAVESETFTGAGHTLARFTHSATGSSGEQDIDFDGFFEWRGTLERGQSPAVAVEILEYSPVTRQLVRRRRRTVEGATVHSVWEEDDGGGLRTIAEFDSPIAQANRPARAGTQSLAQASAADPTIDSSCGPDAALLRDRFAECVKQGLPCLHEKGAVGLETEMSKLITGNVTIFCRSLDTAIAVLDDWYDHPFTGGTSISVDLERFKRQSAKAQAAGLCHELMHGTSLGEHDPSLIQSSGLGDVEEVDRVSACTQMCFPNPLTTKCHCATCLRSTVCDDHCKAFRDCDCDLPAKCLCPFNTKWYRKRSECEADCPRGLRCFGFTRCAGRDVCCR